MGFAQSDFFQTTHLHLRSSTQICGHRFSGFQITRSPDHPITRSSDLPDNISQKERFHMRSFCIALATLSLVAAAAAQAPATTLQLNTIYAGADGKFEAAPDTALLQFNLASQQDTARAAYDKVSAGA